MKATVEIKTGHKGINGFLRAAGLGLAGAASVERYVISYAEGEVVTVERVEEEMRKLQAAANANQTLKTEMIGFRVISIHE